jgi:hypothetical protein
VVYYYDYCKKAEELSLKGILDSIVYQQPCIIPTQEGDIEITDYLPAVNFTIPVNKDSVMAYGIANEKDAEKIDSVVKGRIGGRHITKSDLAVIDILANNNWKRPVYFVSNGHSGTLGLDDYFQLEGFAYRLTPVKNSTRDKYGRRGRVNYEKLNINLVDSFKYGNIEKEWVLVDHYVQRTLNIVRLRLRFADLAEHLIEAGDTNRAKVVLDRIMELTPHHKLPYDRIVLIIAEQYLKIGDKKGEIILDEYYDITKSHMDYNSSIEDEQIKNAGYGREMSSYIAMSELYFENYNSEKGKEILNYSIEFTGERLNKFFTMRENQIRDSQIDIRAYLDGLRNIYFIASKYEQTEILKKVTDIIEKYPEMRSYMGM